MKNIVLCGFMGCGKSSVGKELARRLNLLFADTDEMIVQHENKSIKQIFSEVGENGFRDIEHEICAVAASLKDTVVAVGGGALTFERNVKLFENSTIVYLQVSFDTVAARISKDKSRPLFDAKSAELYNKRLPLYEAAADITVNADGSIEHVVERIVSKL